MHDAAREGEEEKIHISKMLKPSLKAIYQQYKTDTDLVAEWLAVTAKAYDYAATTPSSVINFPIATRGRYLENWPRLGL